MQGIVASLLWPEGDAPDLPFALSPWVDSRRPTVEAAVERVESITWRRFLKTHTPADGLPVFDECVYVAVFRSTLDALASWADHRRAMRPEVLDALNATAAADGIEPGPPWDGDVEALVEEWVAWQMSPGQQLASWWDLRSEPNVLLVHYRDLVQDLQGEMRRVADHLDVEVSADLWGDVVDRCRFDVFRATFVDAGAMDGLFYGGANAFFRVGAARRGAEELSIRVRDRCAELLASEQLTDEARRWLDVGAIASGFRP